MASQEPTSSPVCWGQPAWQLLSSPPATAAGLSSTPVLNIRGLCGLGGACCVSSLSGLCVGKDSPQCLGKRHLLCVLKPGGHGFASLCAVVLLAPPANPVNQSLIHRASPPSPAQQCLSVAGRGGVSGAIPRAGRFRPASNFSSSIGSIKFFARKT